MTRRAIRIIGLDRRGYIFIRKPHTPGPGHFRRTTTSKVFLLYVRRLFESRANVIRNGGNIVRSFHVLYGSLNVHAVFGHFVTKVYDYNVNTMVGAIITPYYF